MYQHFVPPEVLKAVLVTNPDDQSRREHHGGLSALTLGSVASRAFSSAGVGGAVKLETKIDKLDKLQSRKSARGWWWWGGLNYSKALKGTAHRCSCADPLRRPSQVAVGPATVAMVEAPHDGGDCGWVSSGQLDPVQIREAPIAIKKEQKTAPSPTPLTICKSRATWSRVSESKSTVPEVSRRGSSAA